jgi:hypothetical protein
MGGVILSDRRVAESRDGVPLESLYEALVGLAKKRKIRLCGHIPLPERIPEALGLKPKGLCFNLKGHDYIWISNDLPLEKKTFVLAHELGHFVLHNKCEAEVLYDSEYLTKVESDADAFAKKLVAFVSLRLSHR